MILFAALSLAAAVLPEGQAAERYPGAGVRATAQATVRLIEAVTVKFGEAIAADPRERDTSIRLADGVHEAKIVEFE